MSNRVEEFFGFYEQGHDLVRQSNSTWQELHQLDGDGGLYRDDADMSAVKSVQDRRLTFARFTAGAESVTVVGGDMMLDEEEAVLRANLSEDANAIRDRVATLSGELTALEKQACQTLLGSVVEVRPLVEGFGSVMRIQSESVGHSQSVGVRKARGTIDRVNIRPVHFSGRYPSFSSPLRLEGGRSLSGRKRFTANVISRPDPRDTIAPLERLIDIKFLR